jgi:hypothetical protein
MGYINNVQETTKFFDVYYRRFAVVIFLAFSVHTHSESTERAFYLSPCRCVCVRVCLCVFTYVYIHIYICLCMYVQGGSNMTGTNCDLFTHKSSRLYLNHLVCTNECMYVDMYMCIVLDQLSTQFMPLLHYSR